MSRYRLISSDSHINEPPDLWEKRIDAKFKDRAPYLTHEENTDQWYADGDVKFGNIGVGQQAGLRFDRPGEISFEARYADAPLGGMDPHYHVKDMDTDTVAGGVLYPSMGLTVWRDADFAGCIKTRRSTSGGLVMRGSHVIKSWSTNQSVVAPSSGEAE